jgi:hypothetical protein
MTPLQSSLISRRNLNSIRSLQTYLKREVHPLGRKMKSQKIIRAVHWDQKIILSMRNSQQAPLQIALKKESNSSR